MLFYSKEIYKDFRLYIQNSNMLLAHFIPYNIILFHGFIVVWGA